MGKNQRERKEKRLEEKKETKIMVARRAKEKFWSVANPVIKTISTVLFTILIIALTHLSFTKLEEHGKKPVVKQEKQVQIKMDAGIIRIGFYQNDAPKTVENFKLLTQRGYYNKSKFHRVEEGFVIQGGDPLSKDNDPSNDGTGGEGAWGGKFNDELNKNADSYKKGYKAGTVAMANSGPNTNGSQFFICLKDLDQLPRDYTIFGHVTSGMDIVQKVKKDDVMQEVKLIDVPVTSEVKS